ncbi:MAG: hypothetical protein DRP06_02365 [Candidatus Aenigmatarchaeota archaeon]|nr:MAG: hypothetical protein DRP06_02365 [Candidatus Aenigmarchaeota archaeon]
MEMALKSLNPLKLVYNLFGSNGDSVLEEEQINSKYPLDELGKYVGEIIKVHQTDREPETSVLKFVPNGEFFYLENSDKSYLKEGEESGFHIVYWDRTHPNEGGRSAVKLIRDKQDNEIYRNDEIPFKVKE